ncbi:THAP domain-containing protein 3 isoform X1 [Rousettus aegyptiacus]|uniref:THAP domain-containing protein 3 isoform X1 n=1 Tax=Rousettus aegyptiacus TaxID=9407 RepID=UPI00168D9018|nr:THAP domain-containing protein 3 isoform X1 [Rousettus aegyptiacus]
MRAGILLPLCNTQSSTPSRAPRAGPPAAPEGTRESSPGKHSFGNMIMVFSFLLRMLGTATTEPSGNWMWPSRARFPFSRPELLKEWVLNMGRANFKPKQHTVICSEHFRPECFSAFGNRKNLKHNAVPTLFAFQDATQLVRADGDPAGEGGNAKSEKEKVLPRVGAGEHGPERKLDAAVTALQLPPSTGRPVGQVLPHRPEAAEAPGRPASPPQPSDHSYALLDLDALKKKLFLTLKENERLRKRLKAQRLAMRRVCGRLQASGARPRPEQQS